MLSRQLLRQSSLLVQSARSYATKIPATKGRKGSEDTVKTAEPTTAVGDALAGGDSSQLGSTASPIVDTIPPISGDIPAASAAAEVASTPIPAEPLPASTSPLAPAPKSTEALTPTISLATHYLNTAEDREGSYPGERTGAKAKGSGTKSSIEKKRQNLTRVLLALGFAGLVGGVGVYGREWDDEEEKMKLIGRTEDLAAVALCDEGGVNAWVGRGRIRIGEAMDVRYLLFFSFRLRYPISDASHIFPAIQYLNKPAWEPLIPPPLPEPHFRPYTLVVDLDDLLVHSSWDIDHGWRTAKRPGVDYFLAYLSQFYEIVLFTTQPAYTAAPIVEKIDPYGAYIPWKLYRESTRYKNKTLIKDLSYLGRPLNRTIILDTNPLHTQLQPTNAIHLQPWLGKASGPAVTNELVSLIPFLEALAIKGVKDVRTVISFYEGRDIGKAYAEAEEKNKRELREEWEKERDNGTGFVKSMLGSLVKSQNRDAPPETDVEKVRKNAQRMYLEEQKYWKENEAAIKKQMDEDRERQLREMKGSLFTMMGGVKPSEQ